VGFWFSELLLYGRDWSVFGTLLLPMRRKLLLCKLLLVMVDAGMACAKWGRQWQEAMMWCWIFSEVWQRH
jgi:hypothetical protein